MQESMVKYLVCPYTKAPLRLEAWQQEDGHIIEGELINIDDDSRRYPIRQGVPRFVEVEQLDYEQRETVEAFSYKWTRIPDYAHQQATKANRESWYFERFGFPQGDIDIQAFLSSAQFVLEAGTGTGVDTDLLARNFDGLLFGVDISAAVDIAYAQFYHHPRIALLQADIAQLPFPENFFDVISCDQVLHHTPDPAGNFKRLVSLLRPGGYILLYLYRVKGPIREFTDDYLRGILTQASLEECMAFSEKVTRLGQNLSQLRATVEIEDDIPELDIKQGTYNVQRFIYDHILKCFWNDEYDFITNVMVNFDWYRPAHAFRYTQDDVYKWALEERLKIEHLHIAPSGISIIMRKLAPI